MPCFSFIIPVYKVESYLKTCVDSILSQTFFDFEVILVDDGSPDGCPAICDAYASVDKRVIAIHKENEGLSEARNTGLRVATGDYIIFLDSDDYYLSTDFLQQIAEKIFETNCDALFFKRRKFYENTGTLAPIPPDYPEVSNLSCGEIMLCLSRLDILDASASLKVTRRDFLLKNGLYFKKGIFSEDVEWFFRYAPLVKSVALLNFPAYCYRVRVNSISHSISEKNVCDLFDSIKAYANDIRKSDGDNKKALLNYMSYQYYIVLGLCRNTLRGKKRNLFLAELKKYKWLTQYSISRKTKKCAWLLRIFGVQLSSIAFGFFIKNKK